MGTIYGNLWSMAIIMDAREIVEHSDDANRVSKMLAHFEEG